MHESFKKAGYDAGMDEIINKPVYKDDLRKILIKYNIINNWSKVNMINKEHLTHYYNIYNYWY